jgi:hypothetical protein
MSKCTTFDCIAIILALMFGSFASYEVNFIDTGKFALMMSVGFALLGTMVWLYEVYGEEESEQ